MTFQGRQFGMSERSDSRGVSARQRTVPAPGLARSERNGPPNVPAASPGSRCQPEPSSANSHAHRAPGTRGSTCREAGPADVDADRSLFANGDPPARDYHAAVPVVLSADSSSLRLSSLAQQSARVPCTAPPPGPVQSQRGPARAATKARRRTARRAPSTTRLVVPTVHATAITNLVLDTFLIFI